MARDKDKTAEGGLNPLDDIKGAVKFIKSIDPVEEVKEFMETAAKVLEPAESDLRVIEWEEPTVTEQPEPGQQGRAGKPAEAPRQSDAQEMHL